MTLVLILLGVYAMIVTGVLLWVMHGFFRLQAQRDKLGRGMIQARGLVLHMAEEQGEMDLQEVREEYWWTDDDWDEQVNDAR